MCFNIAEVGLLRKWYQHSMKNSQQERACQWTLAAAGYKSVLGFYICYIKPINSEGRISLLDLFENEPEVTSENFMIISLLG